MSRYINRINVTNGRRVQVQSPIDDRTVFYNGSDVEQDIAAGQTARWYEGMTVTIIHLAAQYIWLPTDNIPYGSDMLPNSSYSYPSDYPDSLYAGRPFAFYKLSQVL